MSWWGAAMTDRVTEVELKKIEAAIARATPPPRIVFWWERLDDKPTSVALSSDLAKRLVTDLRRLRQLFIALTDPDPVTGSKCPRIGDRCRWCATRIDAEPPEVHAEDCPWTHLEREVLARIESP